MAEADLKAEQPKLYRPWPKSSENGGRAKMAFLMIDRSPA